MYVFGTAFEAIGPDLARAPGPTSAQLLSANGLPSDLKWIERGVAAEFDQRIHSWLALISVQSVSFPAAISIVHFAVRTGGIAVEPSGLAIEAQNTNAIPQDVIESKVASSQSRCLITNCLLRFAGRPQENRDGLSANGGPARIRTWDRRIMSPLL
jgi:hypothetical protein